MDVTIGMTVDEFEAFIAEPENQEHLFELIHGEVVEKVPTEAHAHIAGIIAGEFHIYIKQQPGIKARFGVEARFRPKGDVMNDRLPDVFFRYTDQPAVTRGPVLQMPDVAVEVQSPNDTPRSLREKARYYLANGTRLVWLIYPQQQIVETYSADDEQILTTKDVLSGGDVLPGFTLPIKALFAD